MKQSRTAGKHSGSMKDFGISASNIVFYYLDPDSAVSFYTGLLGLELVSGTGTARVVRLGAESFLEIADARYGMHGPDDPKTVAIALVTEQLDGWYGHLTRNGIRMKYDYHPKKGSAHDGFVIEDPEGYLIEFERFNEHEENVRLLPILDKAPFLPAHPFPEPPQPGLGFKASVTWLYYKDILAMKRFYEEILGLEMVADQGWVKILQVSKTGFTGLVDEKRGMHHFTEKKAVNVGFFLDNLKGWRDRISGKRLFDLHDAGRISEPGNRYPSFRGFDPEGYTMEFGEFPNH